MDASYCMSITNVKDLEEYKRLLETIVVLTYHEVTKISKGVASDWELSQLEEVVLPEMNELMQYVSRGQLYLKYGRHQRLLESAYLLTDSLKTIADTPLGVHITMLQDKINSQKKQHQDRGRFAFTFDADDFLRYLNTEVLKGTNEKAYFVEKISGKSEINATLYF